MSKIKMDGAVESDNSTRVIVEQYIKAPVQEVFPLVCPVMEYKWIPSWKCELIHCPKGHVELGTVFNEIFSAPILSDSISKRTTWTAVLYDLENNRVHFKLENIISSSLYKLEFEEGASGGTNMKLDLTYRPHDISRPNAVNNNREDKIRLMLSFLSLMLVHYCEQGEMVDMAQIKKLVINAQGFTACDKIKMVLNKLVQKHMRDEDKSRFTKGLKISKVMPT